MNKLNIILLAATGVMVAVLSGCVAEDPTKTGTKITTDVTQGANTQATVITQSTVPLATISPVDLVSLSLANKFNDVKFCEKITDSDERNKCINGINDVLLKTVTTADIENEALTRAQSSGDAKVCDIIQDTTKKQECVDAVEKYASKAKPGATILKLPVQP